MTNIIDDNLKAAVFKFWFPQLEIKYAHHILWDNNFESILCYDTENKKWSKQPISYDILCKSLIYNVETNFGHQEASNIASLLK